MALELAACIGEFHATGVSYKQGDANLVFQFPNTPTDRRFPKNQLDRRLSKAPLLYSGHNIAQNSQSTIFNGGIALLSAGMILDEAEIVARAHLDEARHSPP